MRCYLAGWLARSLKATRTAALAGRVQGQIRHRSGAVQVVSSSSRIRGGGPMLSLEQTGWVWPVADCPLVDGFGLLAILFRALANPDCPLAETFSPLASPDCAKTIPNSPPTFPNSKKTIPNTGKTIPNIEKTIPNSRLTIPNITKTIPNTRLTIPNIASTIPNMRKTIPNSALAKPFSPGWKHFARWPRFFTPRGRLGACRQRPFAPYRIQKVSKG